MTTYRNLVGSLVSVVFVLAILAFAATSAYGSPLKLDEVKRTTEKTPIDVTSPLEVVWNSKEHKVLEIHAYSGGKEVPVYKHEHTVDDAKIKLPPGVYELKGWVPGASAPWKDDIWVRVK